MGGEVSQALNILQIVSHGSHLLENVFKPYIFRLLALSTAVLYIVDIVSDILAGALYLQTGDTWWGILTLCFAGVGLVTSNLVSIWVYVENKKKLMDNFNLKDLNFNLLNQPWKTIFKICMLLQLGMIFLVLHRLVKRFANSRCNPEGHSSEVLDEVSVNSRGDQEGNSSEVLDEDSEEEYSFEELFNFTRLLEAMIEAAPQLILQLFIIIDSPDVYWLTVLTAVTSLLSLVKASRDVYKHDYMTDPDKTDFKHPWVLEVCLVFWPLFTILSRVISIAFFASKYRWIIFPVIGCHYFLTTVESYITNKEHTSRSTKIAVGLSESFIRIFVYVHVTKFHFNLLVRITFFYTLMFIENSIMFGLWFGYIGVHTSYGIAASVVVWGGFAIGVLFAAVFCYYNNPKDWWPFVEGQERVKYLTVTYMVVVLMNTPWGSLTNIGSARAALKLGRPIKNGDCSENESAILILRYR